jgi:alpha-glucosidase
MMDVQPRFALVDSGKGQLNLESADGHRAHIFVLEEDIIRIMVLPSGKVNFSKTWAIAPGLDDVPYNGRDRFDLSGFALPDFHMEQNAESLVVRTKSLRLTVHLTGLFCSWEQHKDGQWHNIARDRLTQSYNFGWWDEKVYHYLKREPDEMYFGLGERAGDANRRGQSYRMCNVDPMGYSAKTTDPLYKHIPFYLTWEKTKKAAFGLFYDTLSDCTFNMGKELDQYHGHYRYFVADYGDLDYYFISGDTIADITRRYTWLTGRPALMPKWGLGYSGSTMSYTDSPNAQERMNEFIERCRDNDILVDSFHLSSGYTSIGPKRYVFHWNRDKFPDPQAFIQSYLDNGIRLCPNIKPCLLRDHPRFKEAADQGLFITNPDGTPTQVQFWDETGSYLDFTKPEAYDWWKIQVTKNLLDYGIAATWNDNNEFEIWGIKPRACGFGQSFPACAAKPLQTLLMLKASREAQVEHDRTHRPFLISRSGAAGMQRYVQTWSGDNYTSWETLKYNVRMGTGLAISGVSNIGHDIGGFAGPSPEPELFLRWVQFGIFLPRFSIHSWNDDGTANEPWMYPEITPHIRRLIHFRYRLIPHLYNLLWRYYHDYEPVIRPTYHDFPDDSHCFEENDEMLLGRELLIVPVVEEGARTRAVYLPAGCIWYNFWTHETYQGGQTIILQAPLDQPLLMAREGSIIPINIAEQHFDIRTDERAFLIFPRSDGELFTASCFEDDGVSPIPENKAWFWELQVQGLTEKLSMTIRTSGRCPSKLPDLKLCMPMTETRKIEVNNRTIASGTVSGNWQEYTISFYSSS